MLAWIQQGSTVLALRWSALALRGSDDAGTNLHIAFGAFAADTLTRRAPVERSVLVK